MSDFFASPGIADLVLAVLVLEGVGLWAVRARTGRGPAPGAFLPFLASGACLVLALRGVLADARWEWVAAALVGALVAHVVDLAGRGGGAGGG